MFNIFGSRVITLPSPRFGNSEASLGTVAVKRTQSGSRRTYVKRRSRQRLIWQFSLTREKAVELRAFLRDHPSRVLRIEDHEGDTWEGQFTTNPSTFEFAGRRAARIPQRFNLRAERVNISLEFEGVRA